MKKCGNLFIIASLMFINEVCSDTLVKEEQNKYAEIYGGLSIFIGAFIYIDERCGTSYISDSMKSHLEKQFKTKTNHTYSEFGSVYGIDKETNERVERTAKNILSSSGGCGAERLEKIYEIVRRDKIIPLMTKLNE